MDICSTDANICDTDDHCKTCYSTKPRAAAIAAAPAPEKADIIEVFSQEAVEVFPLYLHCPNLPYCDKLRKRVRWENGTAREVQMFYQRHICVLASEFVRSASSHKSEAGTS